MLGSGAVWVRRRSHSMTLLRDGGGRWSPAGLRRRLMTGPVAGVLEVLSPRNQPLRRPSSIHGVVAAVRGTPVAVHSSRGLALDRTSEDCGCLRGFLLAETAASASPSSARLFWAPFGSEFCSCRVGTNHAGVPATLGACRSSALVEIHSPGVQGEMHPLRSGRSQLEARDY